MKRRDFIGAGMLLASLPLFDLLGKTDARSERLEQKNDDFSTFTTYEVKNGVCQEVNRIYRRGICVQELRHNI